MKMLYHKDVGFPKGLNGNVGVVSLRYSHHALEAAANDRYGRIVLPETLDTNKATLIEVEVWAGRVTKAVYRTTADYQKDLILVIIPENNGGFVKTVWCNLKTDKHKSLRKHLYNSPKDV
jgi:hypothetical protein